MAKNELPQFEGYTVDLRLRQFRKITKTRIEFIDFCSVKGEKIRSRYINFLNDQLDRIAQYQKS